MLKKELLKEEYLEEFKKDTEKAIKAFVTKLNGLENYEVKCNFPEQNEIEDGNLTFEE